MERHFGGDPGARLRLLGKSRSRIGVKIGGPPAMSREGQKMLWAMCNLLCRLRGVVREIEVCAPGGTPVAEPNMVGRGAWSGDLLGSLKGALDARARECAVSVVPDDLERDADAAVLLGHGTQTGSKPSVKIHASCDGWLAECWYGGAEAEAPGRRAGDSGNPFGAVAAACIASGEVFKHVGGADRGAERPRPLERFSMYDLRCHDARGAAPANPPLPDRIGIGSLAVFGCGAVGHAFCQCLDMTPGASVDLLLVDRSLDGGQRDEMIDGTNLARYVMCTNADLGRPKAEALAAALHGRGGVGVSHTDGGIGEVAASVRPVHLENAVSCVDNNAARHEIQDLRPSRTYGGSVFEMQSQVSVYDAAKGTQCLKCNNPLGGEQGRGAAARGARGRTPPYAPGAAQWPLPPHTEPGRLAKGAVCGTLTCEPHSDIPRLVGADFSVNFATAFSGAVLAAEIVKRSCSSLAPALDCRPNTDMFYSFWSGRPHLTTTAPRAECCGRIIPAQVRQRRARAAA